MRKHHDPQSIKRLDHLGIVAGVIDEIGLVEKIDELIPPVPQRIVSCGNAVKAMILNALGFVSRPLYLHSQFFNGKPVEHLFSAEKTTLLGSPGMEEKDQPTEGAPLGPKVLHAEHFNDASLGRALE